MNSGSRSVLLSVGAEARNWCHHRGPNKRKKKKKRTEEKDKKKTDRFIFPPLINLTTFPVNSLFCFQPEWLFGAKGAASCKYKRGTKGSLQSILCRRRCL